MIEKYWLTPNSNQLVDTIELGANTPIKFILKVTNIGNMSFI